MSKDYGIKLDLNKDHIVRRGAKEGVTYIQDGIQFKADGTPITDLEKVVKARKEAAVKEQEALLEQKRKELEAMAAEIESMKPKASKKPTDK